MDIYSHKKGPVLSTITMSVIAENFTAKCGNLISQSRQQTFNEN